MCRRQIDVSLGCSKTTELHECVFVVLILLPQPKERTSQKSFKKSQRNLSGIGYFLFSFAILFSMTPL